MNVSLINNFEHRYNQIFWLEPFIYELT